MSFFKKALGQKKCTFRITIRVHFAEHLQADTEFHEAPRVFVKCKRKKKVFRTRAVALNGGFAEWEEDIVFGATVYHKKSGFCRKMFIFSIQTAAKELDYSSSLDLAKFVALGESVTKTKTLLLYPSGSIKLTIGAQEVVDGIVIGGSSQDFFFKPGQQSNHRLSISNNAHSVFSLPNSNASSRKPSLHNIHEPIPIDEQKHASPLHSNKVPQGDDGMDHKHIETIDDDPEPVEFNKEKYTDIVSNMLGVMQDPTPQNKPKSFRRSFTRVMKEIKTLPDVERKLAASEAYRAAMSYFKSHRSPHKQRRGAAHDADLEPVEEDQEANQEDPDQARNQDDLKDDGKEVKDGEDGGRRSFLESDEYQPGASLSDLTEEESVGYRGSFDSDLGEDNLEELEQQAAQHAQAIIDILKEEYEVRVVWSTKEVPFGFIEATPMHTLKAARALITAELDNVPRKFHFVWEGEAFPKADEEKRMLIDLFKGDIIRIVTSRSMSRETSRRRAERQFERAERKHHSNPDSSTNSNSSSPRREHNRSRSRNPDSNSSSPRKEHNRSRSRFGSAGDFPRRNDKYAHVQSKIDTGLRGRRRGRMGSARSSEDTDLTSGSSSNGGRES